MANKKGISLIVLVITILVMIILAGAAVLTLANTGIIDKSSEATKAADKANIKALVDVAWADAYASGARKSTEIKAIMQEKLKDTDLQGYSIKVTPNGATVEDTEENGRASGMYVVEAEKNEFGFFYNYAYSINLGALLTNLGGDDDDGGIPAALLSLVSKIGFVFNEDGTADAILGIPMLLGNRPIRIDFMELLTLLAALEGGTVPEFKFEYGEDGVYIVINRTDSNGNEQQPDRIGPIPFSDDGMGIPIGALANGSDLPISEDIGLSCDFNTIHDIYKDKVYTGVLETAEGFVQVKAIYGSDGTFTVYDSLTGQTRSTRATIFMGCLIMTDLQYAEGDIPADQLPEGINPDMISAVSGKLAGVVSADGECIMLTPAEDSSISGLPAATLRVVNK